MFTRKRNLIGFSGPMCSGKTTAARVLVRDVKAFATPLKDCIERLFRFERDQLYTFEGKNAVDHRYGVSPRTVMQNFGTEFVRGTVPDLWLILMEQELDKIPDHRLVVIDDCRFENELHFVRDQGGVVVHIKGRRPVASDHKSEAPLEVRDEDYRIYNTSDVATFKAQVISLVIKISLERGFK
jgi:thymidine kinase